MRRSMVALVVAGVGLASLAGPVLAEATTSFTATEITVQMGAPDRVWVSGHILHIRGEVDTGTLAGDLVGTIITTINGNVDLNTGNGTLDGSFVIATASETWTGSFRGTITPSGGSGSFVGQGVTGTTIIGTFIQTSPTTFIDTGVILDPHG
jgi:formylmethanofuran dehydrogenase subunit C